MNKIIRIIRQYLGFPLKEKFHCYEIWRPNIPDNGCTTQCKECAAEENFIKDCEAMEEID